MDIGTLTSREVDTKIVRRSLIKFSVLGLVKNLGFLGNIGRSLARTDNQYYILEKPYRLSRRSSKNQHKRVRRVR